MIRVQEDDFDLGAEYQKMVEGNVDAGAVVAFVGRVRDFQNANDGGDVTAMTLEHYPGMTEKELERIEIDARARWPLTDSLIIHRVGRMTPGDQIVLVLTASAHRQAAFDAASYLMDYLKTQAPFWKCEETSDGDRWVDARESDTDALKKWER